MVFSSCFGAHARTLHGQSVCIVLRAQPLKHAGALNCVRNVLLAPVTIFMQRGGGAACVLLRGLKRFTFNHSACVLTPARGQTPLMPYSTDPV